MGVAIWLMARLCRVSIPAPGVLVYGAFFWNIGLTIGIISILMGDGRSLETLEMPATAHWIMFIGFVMIGLWGAVLYRHRRQAVAFISVWYLLGALFWFPWVFATTNVLLGRPELHGVMQSVVGAWFAQNLMGWWFTAVGLAAAYFFIPKVADRPIHSYQLASLGFWSFAFLSGLTGMVRLSGGPIPAWLVTVSIAASIMLLVPVSTVTVNLIMTMKGAYNLVYHSPTIRFTFFGAIAFAIANVLGIFTSLRSVDKILHFTPYAQGQQQALLYCFFTMVMFGSIYYITPRLVGCEWLSSTLISLHFWGAAYGGGFIAALLILGGIAQGFTLNDPDGTFVQAIGVLHPFLVGRTFCLLLVAAGHVIFALHFLLMLLRIGQPGGEATLFAPMDEESHH
jgi:cytochrome c oxidase cbb3-type subunit 1